jgi:polar amino acid transport system substrate-binding protein
MPDVAFRAELRKFPPRQAPAELTMKSMAAGLVSVAMLAAAFLAQSAAAGWAQQTEIPQFWDVRERLVRPDISTLPRVRFLTTIDFPPFNYIDANGLITGLHVDLARAICVELGILDRCQIQAIPWEELEAALDRNEGDAIIAGLAITSETRRKYAFSRSYMRFPARFAVRRNTVMQEPIHSAVTGKRVGVLDGSEHEAMLRDYFPKAQPVTYSRPDWLYGDLRDGKIDAVFGDGMRMSFWLAGADSAACCNFAGGPYLAPEYFGSGLSIAVAGQNAGLADAFDFALREINVSGKFGELYLRYFPVGFF